MALDPAQLPKDITILQAMLIAAGTRLLDRDAEIANLKLTIAKMRRDTFGASSERGAKLIDQLELQLADLVEAATEAKSAAEMTSLPAGSAEAQSEATSKKPARRPLPAHLLRERVVHAAQAACPDCGGQLRKLGEDITETLELVPATWKVIQHVREKFSCRICEHITQAPAPSHPIARGRAGPNLLAQVLFAKYRVHIPLNRQSDIYEKEVIDLDVSTSCWKHASGMTRLGRRVLGNAGAAGRGNRKARPGRRTHSL